jgi:hypothetical protein
MGNVVTPNLFKIVGKIEVTGQQTTMPDGVDYAYLRILDPDSNKALMINNVFCMNNVDSYISPGAEGTFFFAKMKEKHHLYGIKQAGREADDIDNYEKVLKKGKRFAWLIILSGVLTVWVAGIGVLIMIPGFMILRQIYKWPSKFEKFEAFSEISQ